jgi:hypothetical protein
MERSLEEDNVQIVVLISLEKDRNPEQPLEDLSTQFIRVAFARG